LLKAGEIVGLHGIPIALELCLQVINIKRSSHDLKDVETFVNGYGDFALVECIFAVVKALFHAVIHGCLDLAQIQLLESAFSPVAPQIFEVDFKQASDLVQILDFALELLFQV